MEVRAEECFIRSIFRTEKAMVFLFSGKLNECEDQGENVPKYN